MRLFIEVIYLITTELIQQGMLQSLMVIFPLLREILRYVEFPCFQGTIIVIFPSNFVAKPCMLNISGWWEERKGVGLDWLVPTDTRVLLWNCSVGWLACMVMDNWIWSAWKWWQRIEWCSLRSILGFIPVSVFKVSIRKFEVLMACVDTIIWLQVLLTVEWDAKFQWPIRTEYNGLNKFDKVMACGSLFLSVVVGSLMVNISGAETFPPRRSNNCLREIHWN